MAIINPTVVGSEGSRRYVVVAWKGLGQGDTGAPYSGADLTDRSVQVVGDFDGGSVAIVGTIDESNYSPLTDPQGNNLVFSATKIEAVTEMVKAIKPDGALLGVSASVDVYMIAKVKS